MPQWHGGQLPSIAGNHVLGDIGRESEQGRRQVAGKVLQTDRQQRLGNPDDNAETLLDGLLEQDAVKPSPLRSRALLREKCTVFTAVREAISGRGQIKSTVTR